MINEILQMNLYMHIVLTLLTIHIFTPILVQLWNFAVAYINDDSTPENHWYQLTLGKIFKVKYITNDDIVMDYWFLGTFIITPTLAGILYFYHITIWFILAYGIAYSARSGRRLQKKFQSHMDDKDAHK